MIHVWCQSETEAAIARAFDGLINVRVHGLGREGMLPAWVNTKKGTPEPWETKLDGATASAVSRTVMHLSAHKGYSGVKDLLMLVVLYTEGGYYFDTTCFMAPVPLVRLHGGAAKTLAEALDTTAEYDKDASTRDMPRFPRIGRLRQWDPASSKDPRRLLKEAVVDDPVMVADVDAWAAYAAPGSPYVLAMLQDYLYKCQVLGLQQEPTPHSVLAGKARNDVIGSLIISSILAGLAKCASAKGWTHVGLADRMWTAAVSGASLFEAVKAQGGDFFCQECGMVKKHKGTWRAL